MTVPPAPSATANVSAAQAKRLAITAPAVAAGMALIAGLADESLNIETARVLAGMVIAMVLLALMAEASPELAAAFAWLLIVTALFVTGEPAWRQLGILSGGKAASAGGARKGVKDAGDRAISAASSTINR